MIQRQAKLTEDELKQVAHIDVSIQHWSMQHTNLSLQAKSMLENISSLEQARNQVMDRALSEAKIDPRTVKQISVAPDGTVNCICTPPPPEPQKTNGATDPAPPPSAEAPKPAEGQSPTS